MDFIWSPTSAHVSLLNSAMGRVGFTAEDLSIKESGDWGTVVATKTPYSGLAPFVDSHTLLIAVGDPLIPLEMGRTEGDVGSWRSKALARNWEMSDPSRSSLRPRHPAALLRVDISEGKSELQLDAFGGVPVFATVHDGVRLVATTPDLLAVITGASVDYVSAAELLAAGRIAFPNTLYSGIQQLMPGSLHRLTDGRSERWWHPPSPELQVPDGKWAAEIESALRSTLQDLARQVGDNGICTLSAGRDTRAVATIGSEFLGLEGVVLTGARNLESWTAGLVARRLRMPLLKRIRPRAHYSAILRSPPIEIGTGSNWLHAHFHGGVLTDGRKPRFILGGYNADTLFRKGGGAFTAWSSLVANRTIQEDWGTWPTAPICVAYSKELIATISERWQVGSQLMGITPDHNSSVSMEYPFSQRLTSAHFHASRRSGPQYEPFMTAEALSLGFRIPDRQKGRRLDKAMFRTPLHRVRGIPVNPGEGRIGSRVLKILSLMIPTGIAPKGLSIRGPWTSDASPRSDPDLNALLELATSQVFRTLGLNTQPSVDLPMMSLALQIKVAEQIGLNAPGQSGVDPKFASVEIDPEERYSRRPS